MMALWYDLGACCLKSAMGTCRESPLGVEPLPGWHSRIACALPNVRWLWGAEMLQLYGCVVFETRALLVICFADVWMLQQNLNDRVWAYSSVSMP